MRTLVWLSLAIVVSGCAESVLIKSYPAGSKAYVDDEYVGSTPVWATLPRSEVGPGHRWRVEYRNCDPVEGELTTGVGAGRVIGYIFTLGISAAFIGPNYFCTDLYVGSSCARYRANATPLVYWTEVLRDKL